MNQPTVVQVAHAEGAGSGTTIAVTITGVTNANGIVGSVTCADNVTVSNVKDQTPTTAQLGIARDGTNLGQQMVLYGLSNSPSGSRTLTATFSGTATSNRGISAVEVSGLASPIVFVGTAGNDSGAGTATSFDATTAIVPSAIGAFILAWGEGGTNLPSAGGAFVQLFNETTNNCCLAYLVQGSAIPVSPSFTMGAADQWNVVLAGMAPAPAGPPELRPLRVGKGLRAPIGSAQPSPPPAAPGNVTITVPVASLTLSGFAPTALAPRLVIPPVAGLVLTGLAPTVSVRIVVPAAALVLTGKVPTVLAPRLVTPPAGALVLTGQVPIVSVGIHITVPTASLALTGKIPTALTPRLVVPPVGALTLTGKVPQALAPRLLTPPTGTLTLTGKAPTVVVTNLLVVQPPTGALHLTGFPPTVHGTNARGGGGRIVFVGAPPALPVNDDAELEELDVLGAFEDVVG